MEVTPDGGRAQLDITTSCCSRWASSTAVSTARSSRAWPAWRPPGSSGNGNGGGTVVGVNNNTDFLRAIGAGTVYAVDEPIHRGRRQQLWLTTITDDNDRVVARGQVRLQNLEARGG